MNNFSSIEEFLDSSNGFLSTFSSLKGAIVKKILQKHPDGLVGDDLLRLAEKTHKLEDKVKNIRLSQDRLLGQLREMSSPLPEDLLKKLDDHSRALSKAIKLRNEFGILGSYLSNPKTKGVLMYGPGLVNDPTIYREVSKFKNFSLDELENAVDCFNFNFSLANKILSNISRDPKKVKDLFVKHYIKDRKLAIENLSLEKVLDDLISRGASKDEIRNAINAFNSNFKKKKYTEEALIRLVEKSKLNQSPLVYNEPISSWNKKFDDALAKYNKM